MLPRVRGPATVTTRGLLAVLLTAALGSAPACGDDEPTTEAEPGPAAPRRADDQEPAWAERLAEPSVADLLAALHQPHALVRQAVGPHRLHVVTDLSLSPPPDPAAEAEGSRRALRPVDEPVVEGQAVHDELTLVWQGSDHAGDHLSLSQHNDHDRGRDVVVVGETVHVRKEHRGWTHYTRDSDVLEHWLDDAQRSVHGAVELAAPRLRLTPTPRDGAGLRGAAGVEIALDLTDEVDETQIASGPTQTWRKDATVEAIEGTLTLDAATGAWLSATIDVRYGVPGADGRPLTGHLRLEATLEADPSQAVSAPPDSQPLPTRIRYEQEQHELLHGLAAP